jgi:hypothetical protein
MMTKALSALVVSALSQEMFARIKPSELLFGNAGKKNKHQLAPHVMQLVNWFNRIVNWVASMIVINSNPKERRLVIKRFLEIADVRCHYSPPLFCFVLSFFLSFFHFCPPLSTTQRCRIVLLLLLRALTRMATHIAGVSQAQELLRPTGDCVGAQHGLH